jgi:hypothetical protein
MSFWWSKHPLSGFPLPIIITSTFHYLLSSGGGISDSFESAVQKNSLVELKGAIDNVW